MSGYLEKPRVRIKAISQFVALPLCDETAVAQAPPRPAPSATAVSVLPFSELRHITKEQFEDLNRRST